MNRLKDKVAIITGGASGVGREDALLMASEGARVVITDVNVDAGRAVAAEIGDSAIFVHHDVALEDDWSRVLEATVSRFGRLDVLVNNAAILQIGSIEDTTLDMWSRVQRINVNGYFLGCKFAVQQMKRNGGGSIVNMASLAALAGLSGFCAYSASKGAVTALTRHVSTYCKTRGYNIRCNSIHPDGIKTAMFASVADHVNLATLNITNDPTTRMCDPIDVANVVLFLASDESRFVNGAEIRVHNGYLMSGE